MVLTTRKYSATKKIFIYGTSSLTALFLLLFSLSYLGIQVEKSNDIVCGTNCSSTFNITITNYSLCFNKNFNIYTEQNATIYLYKADNRYRYDNPNRWKPFNLSGKCLDKGKYEFKSVTLKGINDTIKISGTVDQTIYGLNTTSKSYDHNTDTITVSFNGFNVSEIQLITAHYYPVHFGKDRVIAELYFNDSLTNISVNNIELIDLKTNKPMDKILTFERFNGTNWIKTDYLTGKVRIKTDVEKGENGEWILTYKFNYNNIEFLMRTPEHAIWNETWEKNITLYFTMNETSGTNVYNLVNSSSNGTTFMGIPPAEAATALNHSVGMSGNALNFSNVSIQWVNLSKPYYNTFLGNETTLRVWVKPQVTGTGVIYNVYDNALGYSKGFYELQDRGVNSLQFLYVDNGGSVKVLDSGINLSYNKWSHVVVRKKYYNETAGNITIWINGTMMSSKLADNTVSIANNLHVGYRQDNYPFGGDIDEYGIWQRAWADDEISQDYDNGIGNFPSNVSTKMYIHLVAPNNNTNFTTSTNQFTCNFTDTAVSSGTFYVYNSSDQIVNQTLVSISGTTNYTALNITLSDGFYKWNCFGNQSANFNNWSAEGNYSFGIDTIKPFINITSPINNTDYNTTRVWIEFTYNDTNKGSCYYSNDTFTVNNSLVNCSNLTTAIWVNGFHTVRVYINDTFGNFNSSSISFNVTLPPVTTLQSPGNNTVTFNTTVQFNCNITNYTTSNITLFIWNSTYSQINRTSANSTEIIVDVTLPINKYTWNCKGYDGNWSSSGNWTLTILNNSYNFSLNNLSGNVNYELNTPIFLNASNLNETYCIDINHPDFGVNYTCGYINITKLINISSFFNTTFANGSYSNVLSFTQNLSQVNYSLQNMSFKVHRFDEIDNLSFNISGTGRPENIAFYTNMMNTSIIDRAYFGYWIDNLLFINKTYDNLPEVNLTFDNPGNKLIYFYLDDGLKNKVFNFTLDVSGSKYGFNFTDLFSNWSYISDSETTAKLDNSGVVMAYNSSKSPENSVYDIYDSSLNLTEWIVSNYFSGTCYSGSIDTTETNSYILQSITDMQDNGASGCSGTSLILPNASKFNLYTSENISFGLYNVYYAKQSHSYASDNTGGLKVSLGNTEIYHSNYLNVVYGNTESGNSNLNFTFYKVNNTSWKYQISGYEYSTAYNSGICFNQYITRNYSLGITTNSWDSSACVPVNTTLTNESYITVDYGYYPITVETWGYGVGNPIGDTITTSSKIYSVNRTKVYRENSTIISKNIYSSPSSVTSATIIATIGNFSTSKEIVNLYLSPDNGVTWEPASSGVLHTFIASGGNIKWRADFNTTQPGYANDTTILRNVTIVTSSSEPTNLSFDFGNDGIYERTIGNKINETNGSIIIDVSTANLINSFDTRRASYEHTYKIPLRIHSDSAGLIRLDSYNLTYNPNPITLTNSYLQDYLNNLSNSFGYFNLTIPFGVSPIATNNTVNISGLNYRYAGGSQSYKITLHNPNYVLNQTINLTQFYSRWDYQFVPNKTYYIEFIPSKPTSKNVTPYGQKANISILNITNYGYGNNSNLFVYINETNSCVNLYLSRNVTKPVSSLWDGLVLNMPMDIDARDISGNGNNGTVYGAIYNATGGINNSGGYYFNGISNVIQIQPKPTISGSFSAFAWAQNTYKAGQEILGYQYDGTNKYGWQFRRGSGNPRQLFPCLGNNTNVDCLGGYTFSIIDNESYFVGFTYNATNGEIITYINGVNQSSPLYRVNVNTTFSGGNLSIGNGYNGSIDNIYLFNRTLTITEANQLYNNTVQSRYNIKLSNQWQLVNPNQNYLDTSNIWLWADYNCSYNNWTLFNPNIYFRQCAIGSICSEEVI